MAAEKILVVDDSPTELHMMVEPLINRGYRVITATNGIEALEQVAKELPSLILLDVLTFERSCGSISCSSCGFLSCICSLVSSSGLAYPSVSFMVD